VIPIGADLEIALGSISLWLDGRYEIGLSDLNETVEEISSLKNRSWLFSAGIGFFLK
jgi:hypothetical protein